jgi:hypothetical protein
LKPDRTLDPARRCRLLRLSYRAINLLNCMIGESGSIEQSQTEPSGLVGRHETGTNLLSAGQLAAQFSASPSVMRAALAQTTCARASAVKPPRHLRPETRFGSHCRRIAPRHPPRAARPSPSEREPRCERRSAVHVARPDRVHGRHATDALERGGDAHIEVPLDQVTADRQLDISLKRD